jgi:hypothetical protein
MSKTPGRKPQDSLSRKRQLSSDAKIITTLLKERTQTKEEICKKTKISDRTFYRIISFLEEQQIIKCVNRMYALWGFDFLEKRIEDTLSDLISRSQFVGPDLVVNEIGMPWPEIQTVTFKIVKKLGMTIGKIEGRTVFFLNRTKILCRLSKHNKQRLLLFGEEINANKLL